MGHPLDDGRGRFRQLVDSAPPATPSLPLIHSTDAYALGNMIDDGGRLTPQRCNVFEPERLTYLFYGRPAYRPNLQEKPTDLEHYLPVCFIFKVNASISITRMFPFDSGAFQNDFYKSYLHKRMRLGDFLLEPHAATPGRVVGRFFVDNTSYVMGRPGATTAIDRGQFEALSYAAIVAPGGENDLDSRGAVIEVQTDQEIELKGNVDAAIVPSSLARSEIGARLRDAGITVIPYRVGVRPQPGDFSVKIDDLVLDYLCRAKLVDERRL